MGLLSFFKRQDESTGEVGAPDAVVHARTRARRRLIGATVLLGIGVIGFPLLFETQPRPIPVDIPIEIPRKESVAPLVLPPVQPARPASAAAVVPPQPVADVPMPARPASPVIVTERAAEQGRERAATGPAPVASAVAAAKAPTKSDDDGRRAQALLEGRPVAPKASDSSAARIVVQVGAYTDADKLRDARQKVEKLGMKTYTQVIESEGGKRTRVRVGPFATREEADKAASRIKAAGLPVAVLSL